MWRSPTRWLVIFDKRSAARWMDYAVVGTYKHVRVLGYVPEIRCWLHYDVQFARTDLCLIPNEQFAQALSLLIADADLLWMPAGRQRRWQPRLLLCTTAIAHLLGLQGALRPDTLYRKCLQNGGIPVESASSPAAGAGHRQTFRPAPGPGRA